MANKFLDQAGLGVLWNLIDNNFQRLKYGLETDYENSYVPKKGQICLVITENAGIQIKIGDGQTAWENLDYYNQGTSIIIRGYLGTNNFYYDNILTKQIEKLPHKLYIDLNTDKIYVYEQSQFICLNTTPAASSTTAGIAKLYNSTGNNTDGSITQKAITEELNKKVGATFENGILILK